MKVKRGDVVVTRFPHASGIRGKRRPALVIQANVLNASLPHVLVAEITSNLIFAGNPAFVLIDTFTPEGKATGLSQDSLVSGLFLATVFEDRIDQVIGALSPALMDRVSDCLKVVMELP